MKKYLHTTCTASSFMVDEHRLTKEDTPSNDVKQKRNMVVYKPKGNAFIALRTLFAYVAAKQRNKYTRACVCKTAAAAVVVESLKSVCVRELRIG